MTLPLAQANVLTYLRDYLAANGYPPTRREIAGHCGFASQNAAQGHLEALARKGAIGIRPGLARGLRGDDQRCDPARA